MTITSKSMLYHSECMPRVFALVYLTPPPPPPTHTSILTIHIQKYSKIYISAMCILLSFFDLSECFFLHPLDFGCVLYLKQKYSNQYDISCPRTVVSLVHSNMRVTLANTGRTQVMQSNGCGDSSVVDFHTRGRRITGTFFFSYI